MISVGLVVKLTAKAGKEDELGSFLASALPLAVNEAGTPIWLALKTDASTFWIVDAFPSDAERQAHLGGPIAAALMSKAGARSVPSLIRSSLTAATKLTLPSSAEASRMP